MYNKWEGFSVILLFLVMSPGYAILGYFDTAIRNGSMTGIGIIFNVVIAMIKLELEFIVW